VPTPVQAMHHSTSCSLSKHVFSQSLHSVLSYTICSIRASFRKWFYHCNAPFRASLGEQCWQIHTPCVSMLAHTIHPGTYLFAAVWPLQISIQSWRPNLTLFPRLHCKMERHGVCDAAGGRTAVCCVRDLWLDKSHGSRGHHWKESGVQRRHVRIWSGDLEDANKVKALGRTVSSTGALSFFNHTIIASDCHQGYLVSGPLNHSFKVCT